MSINYPANEFRAVSEAICASAALFTDVLATVDHGGNAMRHALEAARIRRLIACCAWTDAALALLALEQPRWQLRRLTHDSGEWHCALSKHREVPEWLDEDVETHHADMALAILDALLQARNQSVAKPEITVGRSTPDACWEPSPCENYA